jgi:hypothetical protein
LPCFPINAPGQVFTGSSKEVLYKREKNESYRDLGSNKQSKKQTRSSRPQPVGNLPSYFARTSTPSSRAILQPSKELLDSMPGLQIGDMLDAYIPHSVIAFPDEKAPVVAIVTSGRFKGAKLVGGSSLEPNSKRIFIEFTHMTYKKQTAKVKASGLSESGQPGFEGEYHSQELKYFTGDFLASMTAAYFDSQVPRFNTLLGQVQDNSTESALKMGLAAGSMSSARRFREKLQKVPEFSVLNSAHRIQALIY